MTKKVFGEFDIDIEIRFNNRKFLSGILEYSGVSKENIPSFIISVDKLDKMTREEVEKELINHTDKIVIDKVFNYFNYSFNDLKNELENTNIEILVQGLEELDKLINLINELGLNDTCIFTPFLARGLEIYTGSVWEIFDKSLETDTFVGFVTSIAGVSITGVVGFSGAIFPTTGLNVGATGGSITGVTGVNSSTTGDASVNTGVSLVSTIGLTSKLLFSITGI